MTAWIRASSPPATAASSTPACQDPSLSAPRIPKKHAHQEHALEPDVHHAAALGEHAADRREDQRRRVAEHRGGQGPPHEHRLEVRHAGDRGRDAERPERERQHHRRDPEAAAAPPRRPRPQRERRRRDRDRHRGLPRRHRRHGDPERDDGEGDPRDARRLSAPRNARQRPVADPIQRRGAGRAGVVLRHDEAGRGLAWHAMPARQARARQALAPPDGDDQDVGSDEQQRRGPESAG